VVATDIQAVDAGWLTGTIETPYLEIQGGSVSTRLASDLEVTDATLRSGAIVVPDSPDGILRLRAPGTLTIEDGALIEARNDGYPGGTSTDPEGGAPTSVAGSTSDAGGSHGGSGLGRSGGAVAGEVYDSIYRPSLPGAGGALDDDGSGNGAAGGGVVEIIAGTVQFDGDITARGDDMSDSGFAAGAGGTVVIEADSLAGSGEIRVHGGYNRYCSSSRAAGAGGGGRVAILVGQLVDFVPSNQIYTLGGALYSCGWSKQGFAGVGTLYVKTAADLYGHLVADSGLSSGLPRSPASTTPLPAIGSGVVGVADPDAVDPGALWVEPIDPANQFALGVVGAWLRIDGTDYRILEQQDRRRVLLEDAAGLVSIGDSYQGVYKFDSVTAHNGAVLQSADPAEVGTTDVDGYSQVDFP